MSAYAHIPRPEDWRTLAGMGNCFHLCLSRWALLRDEGATEWKIAIAVVVPEFGRDRHIHAWLQDGERVLLATDGSPVEREPYYDFMGVERDTVRLINPRPLLRHLRGEVDRRVITRLLNLWGLPWRANEHGGIIPA